jgi:hypothetical protein
LHFGRYFNCTFFHKINCPDASWLTMDPWIILIWGYHIERERKNRYSYRVQDRWTKLSAFWSKITEKFKVTILLDLSFWVIDLKRIVGIGNAQNYLRNTISPEFINRRIGSCIGIILHVDVCDKKICENTIIRQEREGCAAGTELSRSPIPSKTNPWPKHQTKENRPRPFSDTHVRIAGKHLRVDRRSEITNNADQTLSNFSAGASRRGRSWAVPLSENIATLSSECWRWPSRPEYSFVHAMPVRWIWEMLRIRFQEFLREFLI